jgi:hypothetical protein
MTKRVLACQTTAFISFLLNSEFRFLFAWSAVRGRTGLYSPRLNDHRHGIADLRSWVAYAYHIERRPWASSVYTFAGQAGGNNRRRTIQLVALKSYHDGITAALLEANDPCQNSVFHMAKFDLKASDGRILCEVQKGEAGIDPAGMSEAEKGERG